MPTTTASDSQDEADRGADPSRPTGSGRGADSALPALIQRRVPRPDPPPAGEQPAQ
jgi:hypothetical protein